MNTKLIWAVLVMCVLAVALVFRVPALSLRPMHHDEANQAVKCGVLQETGAYAYDSKDHHGPSLYYITLPFAWLTSGKNFEGTSEVTFRIVPAIFGIGVLFLLLLFVDGLGRGAMLCSAALMAISPAMVFYSRFYIQEMLLVFFTLGAIGSGWRYFRVRTAGWAAATGFFIGMMFVTKETSIMGYAAMAGALVVVYFQERRDVRLEADSSRSAREIATDAVKLTHLLIFAAVAGFVWILFFSSFFTNWRGPVDSILAYKSYAGKSIESDHVHPWYYYLQILGFWKSAPGPIWSEGFILALALVGLIAVLVGKSGVVCGDRRLLRFISVYTIFLVIIYSAIPYKTPWCLLSFFSGLVLLAGVGAVFLFRISGGHFARIILCVLLAAGGWNLAKQSWATNFRFYADPRNPYVYAHTSCDFLNLVKRVETLSRVHSDGKKILIAVVASPYETWPLPWYLRSFPMTGFWQTGKELADGFRPALAVVSSEEQEAVQSRLGPGYHVEYFGLRPGVLLALFVDQVLWDSFIQRGGAAGFEKLRDSSKTDK